jgi:hypothetical protein
MGYSVLNVRERAREAGLPASSIIEQKFYFVKSKRKPEGKNWAEGLLTSPERWIHSASMETMTENSILKYSWTFLKNTKTLGKNSPYDH